MKRICSFSVRLFLLIYMGMPCFTDAAESNQIVICVVSPSPLSGAFDKIAVRYGCIINYEEPDYYDDVDRLEVMVGGGQLVTPRTRCLSFSFCSTNTVAQAIEAALTANAIVDPGVVYQVAATNFDGVAISSVVPLRWKSSDGAIKRTISLLNRRLSFDARSGENQKAVLNRLMAEITKGTHYQNSYFCGNPLWSFQSRLRTGFSVTNTPVYQVLHLINKQQCWRLQAQVPFQRDSRTLHLSWQVIGAPSIDMDRFVFVYSKRPIAEALRFVSMDQGISFGYEDPNLNGVGIYYSADKKSARPAGGYLSANYKSTQAIDQILEKVINGIVLGPYKLHALNTNEFRCVAPLSESFHAKLGAPLEFRDYEALSKIHVSLEANNELVVDILRCMCQQLHRVYKKEVVLTTRASVCLADRFINFRCSDIPFWLAISNILGMVPPLKNWVLLYMPASDSYVLDVYDVKETNIVD